MVFLGAAIALWVARSPAILTTFWRDIAWRYFICAGLVYWWISYLITGDYTENIRVFELLLCAIGTFLAGTRRSWIASALLSMAISSSALAIGFLPYSGRLGVAAVADKQFGNPVLIGLPTAMVLLLSVADNGSWMLLDKRPFLRFVVSVSAGEWLILSGSRGAWAAAIAGLFVVMVIDKRARGPLIVAFMLLGMVTAVMLTSHRGAQAALQFEKTIDSGRSIANRTSGRSEQWRAIPQVFLESPLWGWGPGSGKQVVVLYTGRHLAWHSLFLNIIGETGLIGLIAVGIIFGSLLSRDLRCWRQWGEITPLVATIAYLVIGLSVSGMDGVCGILVGLGFLGRGGAPRFIARHGVLRPQQEMPLAEARGSENGR